ncbi:MAG TPA: hypothetical protein VK511_06705, partial [Gemmatimonadaceae bacterium]|nr:hypothetical protein [Gemmatimonadaceae bacterium]
AGRLVGEREDADPLGLDLELVDQEADAPDEAESFSSARAGENEERLGGGFDREKLRRRRGTRNRNGVGAYRRRFRFGPAFRYRGSVRVDGRRQDVL